MDTGPSVINSYRYNNSINANLSQLANRDAAEAGTLRLPAGNAAKSSLVSRGSRVELITEWALQVQGSF